MARAIGLVALLAVTAVASYFVGARNAPHVATDPPPNAPAAEEELIAALGKLEPVGGILNISALPGDQIDVVEVQVGQIVKPGDTLVTLQSRKLRKLELDLATARMQEAKQRIGVEQQVADSQLEAAMLAAEEVKLREQELTSKQSDLRLLRRQAEQQRRSLARLESLRADPVTREVTSADDVEKLQLVVDKLESDIAAAEAALKSATAAHELAVKAAASKLKAARHAAESVEQASPLGALQTAVELASLNYDLTQVIAPDVAKQYRVLRVIAKRGERVANLPLLQLGDTSRIQCIAEVYESNLPQIKPGQRATMTSPAIEQELRGVVTQAGLVVGRPQLPNPNPLSRQDVRTGEVEIELDEASSQLVESLINLRVDVKIHLQENEAEPTDAANSRDSNDSPNAASDQKPSEN